MCVCVHMCVLFTQSCLIFCDPMDCGTLQARTLEWVAISFSRGSFCHWDQTLVFHILGRFFTVWATREVCSSKTSLLIFQLLVFCIYRPSFRYLILMRSEMSLRKIMMYLKFLLNLKQNNGWSKFLKGNCFYN